MQAYSLQPGTLLKTDFIADSFLGVLRNYSERLLFL